MKSSSIENKINRSLLHERKKWIITNSEGSFTALHRDTGFTVMAHSNWSAKNQRDGEPSAFYHDGKAKVDISHKIARMIFGIYWEEKSAAIAASHADYNDRTRKALRAFRKFRTPNAGTEPLPTTATVADTENI